MEDRIIVALFLAGAMLLGSGWWLTRSMRERRKFKLRQQGRGKTAVPAE